MNKYKLDLIAPHLKERFHTKYEKDPNGCWSWLGFKTRAGYGLYSASCKEHGIELKNLVAHRVSWMLHHNLDWPGGLEILHQCNNRSCVNPDHLVPGTHKENMKTVDTGWKKRPVLTPLGQFNSVRDAIKAETAQGTINAYKKVYAKLKVQNSGYKYLN